MDEYYTYTGYSFCPPERKIPWLLIGIGACAVVVVVLLCVVVQAQGPDAVPTNTPPLVITTAYNATNEAAIVTTPTPEGVLIVTEKVDTSNGLEGTICFTPFVVVFLLYLAHLIKIETKEPDEVTLESLRLAYEIDYKRNHCVYCGLPHKLYYRGTCPGCSARIGG